MYEMKLLVHAPLRSALKSGRARYGTETVDLSDEFVAKIPEELRTELAHWIEALQEASERQYPFEEAALDLESPDITPENVSDALRRARAARRERQVQRWLDMWKDDDWLFEDNGFDVEVHVQPEVLQLRDDARIAERLPRVEAQRVKRQAAIEENSKRYSAAWEGLTAYAKSIPEYARAAKEKYDVRSVALDHYLKALAGVGPESLVLVKASDEFKKAKLEERTAPNRLSFGVLDDVNKAIGELPKPDGVDVEVGRVHRFRRALADKGKWLQDEPVTVVPVTVRPHCLGEKMVLFFADAEEKKRFFVDEEIPF